MRYLVSYRKVEERAAPSEKPEWTSFSFEHQFGVESHAVRDRVARRLDLFGERLYGSGEVLWIGKLRLDDLLVRREEVPGNVSIIYGAILED